MPWPGCQPAYSTPSPAHCSSTTPNGRTCSTSPEPQTAVPPSYGPGAAARSSGPRTAACNGPSTPSPKDPRSCATGAWTCSPRTGSPGPSTPRCTPTPSVPRTLARFTFLDDNAHRFYPDWDSAADICVAILRTEAGRDPRDKDLHDLVGELSTRSTEFRARWGAHNVRHHGTGAKTFHHHIIGDLTLAYEGLEMAAEPGLTLTIYTAEPDSPSEDALRLLASWAASQEADTTTRKLSTE